MIPGELRFNALAACQTHRLTLRGIAEQFLQGQAPMMQNLMGSYVEQSKAMFQQMQEQLQKTSGLFPGMPGFPPKSDRTDR